MENITILTKECKVKDTYYYFDNMPQDLNRGYYFDIESIQKELKKDDGEIVISLLEDCKISINNKEYLINGVRYNLRHDVIYWTVKYNSSELTISANDKLKPYIQEIKNYLDQNITEIRETAVADWVDNNLNRIDSKIKELNKIAENIKYFKKVKQH
jgi:hypothetical protein